MDVKTVVSSEHKVRLTFGIAWDRTFQNTKNKQTVFPVYPDENKNPDEYIPHQGKPSEDYERLYTLRATKAVNLFPYPYIQITNIDGTAYNDEETVKISIISNDSDIPPGLGTCPCGNETPKLQESQEFQLKVDSRTHETYATIKGGKIEFLKMQIGCCTGTTRGHGSTFRLKVEFVNSSSPLFGRKLFSRSIEVAAKGPFAKINCVTKRLREPDVSVVPMTPSSNPSPLGPAEIFRLLKVFKEIDTKLLSRISEEKMFEMATLVSRMTQEMPYQNAFEILPSLLEGNDPQFTPSSWNAAIHEAPEPPTISEIPKEVDSFVAPVSKRRKIVDAPLTFEGPLSIYIFLSNIVMGEKTWKKVLFMVKSRRTEEETTRIVQMIHQDLTQTLKKKGKKLYEEGMEAQLMLALQPGRNNEWIAVSQPSRIWNFKDGDYIKIENRHSWDVSICVNHYTILDKETSDGRQYVEDNAPSKYPVVFPGGALEIEIEGRTEGKLTWANMSNGDVGETFAVTKHGKLVAHTETNDCCTFSLKRKKHQMIKNDSFDDFLQKEIFVSKAYSDVNVEI